MELEFFGAAGEVTGSCHILRVGESRVLLDCGMIQGGRRQEARNREPFPFDAHDIDAVILSHAHIDHSGRLPLLVGRGFSGAIHAHNATCDLAEILLEDGAYLAASFARHENRRREKRGEEPIEPLYTVDDARAAIGLMAGVKYRTWVDVCPGVAVRFHDAGHIMGSCLVEVRVQEAGAEERTVVFSGDLGQYDTPILRDPVAIGHADVVLMESTYGGRNHRDRSATLDELQQILDAAADEGGNVLIPAFAVGRSQELLYQFGKHFDEWNMRRWRVFLDSPLAIKTSEIYWDYPHLYDDEATTLRRDVDPMPMLDNLVLSRTADQSREINRIDGGAIVIAGSGMLNGGRMLHHLKRNLGKANTRLLFTGFQPPGSLGRRLIEGADTVRVHGREFEVAANVHTVGGMSAHGDQNDLLRWYRSFSGRPPVFLVHGDEDAALQFKHKLANEAGAMATVAAPGMRFDLKRMRLF